MDQVKKVVTATEHIDLPGINGLAHRVNGFAHDVWNKVGSQDKNANNSDWEFIGNSMSSS
jgi:hypothetical protein